MKYKILHIPTGEIFQVVGARARSLDRFKEEFKVAMYYVSTPITKKTPTSKIKENTIERFRDIGFSYDTETLSDTWLGHFIQFAVKHSLNINDASYVFAAHKVNWKAISISEFEVLND